MAGPTAAQLLDREFVFIRSRLLDLAAALDRVDQAAGQAVDDPRRQHIHAAIDVLAGSAHNRAEQVQHVFSSPYSKKWRREYDV